MNVWDALGTKAKGERLARMQASQQYQGKSFENRLPVIDPPALETMVKWFKGGPNREPKQAPEIFERKKSDFEVTPESGLRITWLGHSTMIIEIDGYRVLTDPVWGERCSPSTWFGPRRFHAPPLALDALPKIDAVIISHDHYDHLDTPTIKALAKTDIPFLAPLGVGAHLEHWGVKPEKITELDWWQSHSFEGLKLTATPARHFSGRGVGDRNQTLWASWVVQTEQHKVYFSGDTGMFPGFKEIGDRMGPFDVTMIEVGAYHSLWADVHLGPEQAVAAHRMLRGKLMLPIHWGTFNLALHGWTEPAQRLEEAVKRVGVELFIPQQGQSFEPSALPPQKRWWPALSYEPAADAPVVSSGLAQAELDLIKPLLSHP